MAKTRFTAEVDSETLSRATEVLARAQTNLDETFGQMLEYIVSSDAAPCFECGEPNAETLEAMAQAERGELTSTGSIAELFAKLNAED